MMAISWGENLNTVKQDELYLKKKKIKTGFSANMFFCENSTQLWLTWLLKHRSKKVYHAESVIWSNYLTWWQKCFFLQYRAS